MGKSAKFTRRPGSKFQKQAIQQGRINKAYQSSPDRSHQKQAFVTEKKPEIPKQIEIADYDDNASLEDEIPVPSRPIVAHKQSNYTPSGGKDRDYVKLYEAGRKKKMSFRKLNKKKIMFNKGGLASKTQSKSSEGGHVFMKRVRYKCRYNQSSIS